MLCRDDWDRLYFNGAKITVEIPKKKWTLVIGFKLEGMFGGKYTVGVNGVEMSALPEAPKSADSQPEFCKSSEHPLYSENIRSVCYAL